MTRHIAALAVGADMAFVETIPTLEELAEVPRRIQGPSLLNVVRGGETPELNPLDAPAMGYRLAILPSLLLGAVMAECDATLLTLKEMPPATLHERRA